MELKKNNIKRYGLIGRNIEHSFSRRYFKQKFEIENLSNYSYENFDLKKIGEIKSILAQDALFGFNVTSPYKRDVIPFLNHLTSAAAEINAVNTIKYEKDGSLSGHNTDVYGFEKSLREIMTEIPEKALILGTGGASSAVAFVLKKMNIEVTFVSRREGENFICYDAIDRSVIRENLLIVNASPLGSFPNSTMAPNLPYKFITEHHILYDLIYNPPETLFLSRGKKRKCKISNGQKMLEYQAEKSWYIWNQ